MRRFSSLLMCLVLLMFVAGDVFSLSQPYQQAEPEPEGEDHPWGGDRAGDPEGKDDGRLTLTTGNAVVDLMMSDVPVIRDFRGFVIGVFERIQKVNGETQEPYLRSQKRAYNFKTQR